MEEKRINRLIELYERKNLCFRSFHKLSDAFYDSILKDDLSGLDEFQKKRDTIIKTIESIEKDVQNWLALFDTNPDLLNALMTNEVKQSLSILLKEKDSTVQSIINLDLQILQKIDQLKADTIQKLNQVQTNKKTIGAYKSPLQSIENEEEKNSSKRDA